ncbi:MAG: acid-soluble spore protein N [Bacillota bacterium]|nr:acid-soluble spore protein N [Bacillota bacterium]
MSNPKKNSKPFVPNQIGTQPHAAGGNKGKQMQDKSGKHPQVIQTKGE